MTDDELFDNLRDLEIEGLWIQFKRLELKREYFWKCIDKYYGDIRERTRVIFLNEDSPFMTILKKDLSMLFAIKDIEVILKEVEIKYKKEGNAVIFYDYRLKRQSTPLKEDYAVGYRWYGIWNGIGLMAYAW